MDKHFQAIERELNAAMDAVEAGEGDRAALLERLESLLNNVRGKRFATGFALFGKQFKPGGEPAKELEGVEPPPRQFERGDLVRTKDDYLAYVGYYDQRGRVVANVVFQACDFNESELTAAE
ncbi:hypothetical protein [Burkholderia ubonensis]|uniref:Uncharacterized protein n=1 Tax=Burkholderia ubonensis TaxID=101571 RepID=A0ABD4E0U6_9BURK|nr:hypothetical protein [Burkholderia ubonensis]KVN83412.1 hypothetical protein WJ68_15975 [Burkholderia ubonensis]